MVFFYRRFLPLDVCIYAFGAENVASSSNLTIPFIKQREAISNFAFEAASSFFVTFRDLGLCFLLAVFAFGLCAFSSLP
jgi:hypothetical protein